ncbi:translational machinery component, partial [Artomyces pyxidatus]
LQFHLHVRCTANNTHVVLTNMKGQPVPEGQWSGGTCGFKGVNRSGYEAGYQCAVRAFERIKKLSLEQPGARYEMVFKGFGQGRDAVYKALMTSEGDDVRPFVNRVTDQTPIKIGGTRAKKMRRL